VSFEGYTHHAKMCVHVLTRNLLLITKCDGQNLCFPTSAFRRSANSVCSFSRELWTNQTRPLWSLAHTHTRLLSYL